MFQKEDTRWKQSSGKLGKRIMKWFQRYASRSTIFMSPEGLTYTRLWLVLLNLKGSPSLSLIVAELEGGG